MRVALVSPYSWTYPGGVTRHIEALAGELMTAGHDVRVLAPFDPADTLSVRLHRGAAPQVRPMPDWLVPLGRTVGLPANGAVSNLAVSLDAITRTRQALRAERFDVVHLHEPIAPHPCWDAMLSCDAPLVGTFHCYSTNVVTNNIGNIAGARRRMNRLAVRIAVSEAAAWTGRRFFGGEYRVIPNGVEVPGELPAPRLAGGPLRVVFIGQAVERKGLPILLRAFEALREHVPATLTLVGPTDEDVAPLLLDARGVRALGRVDDEAKRRALAEADVLAAPSLGGESFGMVLTEGFAAGLPVVASDIAGYQDVVRDGADGVLVPRGDAVALAEALRGLALDPARRARMAQAAAEHARRFAWPAVAAEVAGAYEDAMATPDTAGVLRRVAVRHGLAPVTGAARVPARRLPSMEPAPAGGGRRSGLALARRIGLGVAGAGAAGLAVLALDRIGVDRIGQSLLHSSPPWVLVALALMCLSMAVRAVAWHAILKAALPQARPRLADALQGTFIGVLMSATLPARLGEPSRAMIVARRLGRAREHLPAVLGTIVSQTMVNILALVLLGATMFSTLDLFDRRSGALWLFALLPIAILFVVLAVPLLLRGGVPSRFRRVQAVLRQVRRAMVEVRGGLRVFRDPKLGATAVVAQLAAWAIQWVSCYVLLVAFGLDERAGMGAAAAVLFAVNVSAVLPATPSNVGVFQAACVFVLSGAYGVGHADALGYGIVLQAVEIATAVIMGAPALLKEGLSWRDIRLRALHAAPVRLSPLPGRGEAVEVEA